MKKTATKTVKNAQASPLERALASLPVAKPIYEDKKEHVSFRPGNGRARIDAAMKRVGHDVHAVARALAFDFMDHEDPLFDVGEEPAVLEPLYDLARAWTKLVKLSTVTRARLDVRDNAMGVIEGNLRVTGDVKNRGILIVLGDLDVGGTLRCYGDEWSSGALVVLGRVKAARMISLSPTVIGKSLEVPSAIYVEHFHDCCSSLIASSIKTPTLVSHGDSEHTFSHRMTVKKRVPAGDESSQWLEERLPKWFEDYSRTFDLDRADAKLFAALRALSTPTKPEATARRKR